ncbi:Gfo/Idh/MocA family protein [Glycomyces harbinensis]|uniref:Predicted dehydrogenase n=1 Tax=Glycomyces harbinensis TaxID=58114 RepID=A0A1G6UXZ9_9ACTN|nr:Gfo/Idh/MocA family oxidoreductase [Glycomyces harbinensis]SDD46113.1 Predicted dehydrogenase [Glycomyces harbinensis]
MTADLRAGLIGLGAMGRNHARVLAALEGVDLVGVADPVADGSALPSGAVLVGTVEELIGLGIDYAVVACPTGYHEQIGLALAEAGVHALIEKPLAHSVEASERLVEAFGSRGLVAGVGHIERFNPAIMSLRQRLEAGELGEILQVVTRRQGPFPGRIADVGVVKDLATHDIDLTSFVTGQSYRSITAQTVSRSGREHEDMLSAIGQLSGGAIANHSVNWLSPFKERTAVVTGDRGCFVADTLTADLTFYANGVQDTEWEALRAFRGVSEGDMVRYAIRKREPLQVEHEQFRNAVRGEESDIVDLESGAATVVVSETMLRSAALGETVLLDGSGATVRA